MAAAFVGKFKLVSQENFDEYLKAIGVGMAKRALARAATPTVDYSMNGDEMTVTTTGMRDTSITFKIGVEKDEETADGRKVKSVFSVEDGKLVQRESWDGKVATISREVDSNGMLVTITLDGVVCTRKYTRV